MKAYLGIGTNLGDRIHNLRDAISALNLLPFTKVTDCSDVYETDPVGYANQEDFLNIVVEVETELNSDSLLGAALGIEAGFGRLRTIKNGPRIIDIDVLLYENESKNTATLILPHPRMMERDFVLVPLLDLNFDELLEREMVKKAISNCGVRFFCSKEQLN